MIYLLTSAISKKFVPLCSWCQVRYPSLRLQQLFTIFYDCTKASPRHTCHRLVFALCVTDLITSVTHALSSVLTPQEMSYFTPFAKGNVSMCDAQGFLIVGGYTCALLYNSSMCFYYLVAIIKYNKKAVSRIKKRNQTYGVHSLRQRIQQRSSVNDNLINRLGRASGQTPPNHLSRRDYILSMRLDRASNNKPSIMHMMAMGYALTWILTWAPMIMYLSFPSHFTGFLVSGISPLQGFFNIIVYMAPKVRNAKKSKRQKITRPQAIWKVWTSKGD